MLISDWSSDVCSSDLSDGECASDAQRHRGTLTVGLVLAASSSSALKLASRDRTTIVTNGKQKVIWAIVIANRFSGQIRSLGHSIQAKKISMAKPRHITGTMIGSAIVPCTPPLMRKLNRQRQISDNHPNPRPHGKAQGRT